MPTMQSSFVAAPRGGGPPPASAGVSSGSAPGAPFSRPALQRRGTTISGLTGRFFIAVNQRLRRLPWLSLLQPHTYNFQDIVPDFVTAAAVMVYFDARELASATALKRAMERLRVCQPAAKKPYFALLFYDSHVHEPPLDVLTFANEACIEVNCTLMLCCGARDAAMHLEHLANTSSVSADVLQRPKDANARDAAISGLTETGKVNVSDARKLLNCHGTVAELLQCAPEELVRSIPGFGTKKAAGLAAVLNAPFPTRRRRLDELQATPLVATGARPTPQPSDALALALARIDAHEGDDAEDDDKFEQPLFFSSLEA